ncbi:biotin transporter BioY [Wolbachia endosymbiont of Chironomus riparius]|uniref:biotin transporter BioY n=1 Tax=Wolbachia endosymbiont of Chironomus riparius TaxID=2883238 RepID=UPI00209E7C1E|nr:biotin transporter BioY [Wolbachia endosymbiont of Chironomus riparius]
MYAKLQNTLTVNTLIEVLLCVLLLFSMAQISIPLQPVPVTLQTLIILIIGLKCDRKVALYSVLTYIFLGAIGLPVFANFSGGYHILLGPTGGYLIGFLVAALAMSNLKVLLKPKYLSFMFNALSCLVGTFTIFICGVSWLSIYVGLKKAFLVGVLPFVIPGIVKICLLLAIIHYLNSTKE